MTLETLRPALRVDLPEQTPVGPSDDALSASVVICAYTEQRWDQLQRAVASVRAQTHPVAELLVVVDHNSSLFLRAAQHLDARVLQNERTRGLSGARNTGVEHASGDVVVFLDDDAYAEPDWLQRLLAVYRDPEVLGVGGGVEAAFEGDRPGFLPEEFHWVVGCSYRGQPTSTSTVRNMIGANMSFRREVFARAGGFEESLGRVGATPLGCEETEFCIRAARALPGGRVMLEPAARVHHEVPAGRTTWSYFRSRCYSEGLSKAAVARLAGAERGLASERRYVSRVLPAGVARGVGDAVSGRPSGLVRASAILTGLALTTVGYLSGTVRLRRSSAPCVMSGVPAGAAPREARGLVA
jgi:GT2 family glycosyltransferase